MTDNAPPGQFFSWAELTASRTAAKAGLSNWPGQSERAALRALVAQVLDPLRLALGRPVRVTSGYRSAEVNARAGGSSRSQHVRGEAVDIKVRGIRAQTLATRLHQAGLPYDQLIWYDAERGGHIHVSYTTRRKNRRMAMHAPASGGYQPWVPPDGAVA